LHIIIAPLGPRKVLCIVDIRLIIVRKKDFEKTESGKKLYDHIYGEQLKELTTLVPLGLLYNITAFYLIMTNPRLFLENNAHVYLIGAQVLFEIIVLIVSLRSFKNRSTLITQAI
jgi:hypothetical protein